jgi:fibronectin-binding autotransporter adhesin
MRTKILVAATMSFIVGGAARAQFSANFQTNSIAGVTSNWMGNGTYVVGSNTFRDALIIQSGGVLSNSIGYVGYETGGSNNVVLVNGTGSVWSNFFHVIVGNSGAGNSLIISNGGAVFSSNNGTLGANSSSSGNTVTVTGTGSTWTHAGTLTVGGSGSGNTLTITNGGAVFVNGGTRVGLNSSSSNNVVLVSGTGSSWMRIGSGGALTVGQSGAGNRLTIADGGRVIVNSPVVPTILGSNSVSSGNTVTVTDPGSTWSTAYGLIVGDFGADNSLTISNGGNVSTTLGGFSTTLGRNSSSSNNAVLVTGTGSVWTNTGMLIVGGSGSGNTLTIGNGGAVYNGVGILGSNQVSSGNAVVVTGTGSVWSNQSDLHVGYRGPGNSLTIANGGVVFNTNGHLGFNVGSTNNSVSVSGTGSVWSNTGSLTFGFGIGNTLTISNGGAVFDGECDIGTSSNRVTVTGSGSIWSNQFNLYVSQGGLGNSLTIANGGAVFNGNGYLGTNSGSNNTMTVTDSGSVWDNQFDLYVGDGSAGNSLTIINGGAVLASNVYVGFNGSALGNRIHITGGGLYVTNASGDARLVVGQQSGGGTVTLNDGTVSVNRLMLTNGANSVFTFNSGLLTSGGASVTNGQTFAVGAGVKAAMYHLLGGVHSFADGLEVSSNAVLSGCGTISGTVVVDPGGMVLADCGGSLTFTGILTNNGTMKAINGSVLEGYSLVVNNGTIDITNGSTNFHGGFINNGTIITGASPAPFQITGIVKQGSDIRITWQTPVGSTNALQATARTGNGSYSTNNFAAIFTVTNAVTTVTNYLDVGGATNTPSRYYRVRLVP